MIRSILTALVLATGCMASATTMTELSYSIAQNTIASPSFQMMANKFKQGDSASYNMSLMSFPIGTMTTAVKSITVDEIVISQEVTITLLNQKQSCDMTLAATGQMKSMVCDGKPQDVDVDVEVTDTKEDHITVPAGSFDCVYMKAHNKKANNDIEQWINPTAVPVIGLIKTILPSPLGAMTAELTSFVRN